VSHVQQFHKRLVRNASTVVFHRDDSTTECPCRTPEGNRDPIWHAQHPMAQVCNEAGFLPDAAFEMEVKAFVQPIQSTRATRLTDEYLVQMFGQVEANDHLGIFPCEWNGREITFDNWGSSGEDYVVYAGKRFTVVNVNTIPDPSDGNPFHHHEVGLRLIEDAPLG
jgi:hypothetical protein